MADSDLLEALHTIPANLPYGDWLNVGMALKAAGYPLEVWDSWSQTDPAGYHKGECARKWKGFSNTSQGGISELTIFQLAKEHGYRRKKEQHAIGWDDWIGTDAGSHILKDSGGAGQLRKYLETLFDPDDIVNFVTNDVYSFDGVWKPGHGTYRKVG